MTLWVMMGDAFDWAQQQLFDLVLQPLVVALGWWELLDQAYEGAGWLLVGLLQLLAIACLLRPLERRWPAEAETDRQAVRVDVLYTLIHRLGLFRLIMFGTFEAWFLLGLGWLRLQGFPTWHLDQIWPGVTDVPVVSFVLYLVVLDLVNYWIHRAQHQFGPWWALHSLHHSQRQMTAWSDNRNHLLDDVLTGLILMAFAALMGAPPGQFLLLLALGQMSESLQHANLRWHFGAIGERLWVSPRFHRRHHAIGLGHEQPGRPQVLGGCNFGVLLPWWDMCWGTANFERRWDATGVRDQIEQGRDYGRGFWAQQWRGLQRLGQALRGRA